MSMIGAASSFEVYYGLWPYYLWFFTQNRYITHKNTIWDFYFISFFLFLVGHYYLLTLSIWGVSGFSWGGGGKGIGFFCCCHLFLISFLMILHRAPISGSSVWGWFAKDLIGVITVVFASFLFYETNVRKAKGSIVFSLVGAVLNTQDD